MKEDDGDRIGRHSKRLIQGDTKPTFKVVSTSPVRVINEKNQKFIHSPENRHFADSEQNATSDFSFTSDLNKNPNRRLHELVFPSQEDVADDKFYTPTEDPSETFESQQTALITNEVEKTSTMELQKSADVHKDNDSSMMKDHLIDDLEFSSFRMSFDDTRSETQENEHDLSKHINHSIIPDLTYREQETKEQGPHVYVLPKSASIADKTSNDISNQTDDPIWISPSKLQYFETNDVQIVQQRNKASFSRKHHKNTVEKQGRQ